MLVLSRKATQQIRIGSDVTITVLKVTGSVVRLGIEAPQGVRILRAELTAAPPASANEPAGDAPPANGAQVGDSQRLAAAEDSPMQLAVDSSPVEGCPGRPTQAARRPAPPTDTPRCRVLRAGFRSPGRHPSRGEPASVAVGARFHSWA